MPEQLSGVHARIEAERKRALPKPEDVKKFRNYARGRHPGTLTIGQQRILRGLLGNLFCDNVCKRILQELRNRLRLARFDVAAGEAEQKALLTFLKDLWVKNKLAATSAAVHWAMFRDGNTAVTLNWVGGRAVITRERWWNGKTGIFVAYDDNDQVTYAVKEWNDGSSLRRTVYWPDRIERYKQEGESGWRLFRLPSDPVGEGALPWVDSRQQPLGVPVVHFANLQVPNDGDGDDGTEETDPHYGMSELDGGMLGLQDEVNDVHRDISAGARFAGYQMGYATGVKKPVDSEGNEMDLKPEPGAFFQDENPDAKFGILPAGSLEELERTLMIKVKAMSRAACVPLHIIAGDWPSGEALLREEMPLIDKVETVGEATGPGWASVGHKSVVLSNAFGSTSYNPEALITATFLPVARRDLLTLASIADKLSKHVGQTETLRLLNYSPDDIARILADLKANPPTPNPTPAQQ
jgi:hypothetical protein